MENGGSPSTNIPSLKAGNQWELGRKFRDTLCRRLRRLHAKGKLQFVGESVPDSHLLEPMARFSVWDRPSYVFSKNGWPSLRRAGFACLCSRRQPTAPIRSIILKYLARYVSGGPISNSRLVSWENGQVTFLARSKEDALPGQAKEKVPITISEVEFVRRWSTHILPKGFTRVRHYGMSSNRHRAAYLQKCRELLGIDDRHDNAVGNAEQHDEDSEQVDRWDIEDEGPALPTHHCPKCGKPMRCLEFSSRPSWKVTMTGQYRPEWYT